MIRRSVHAVMLLRRALTVGVRAVVENEQGAILLVRHTYVKGWHFPGGGVEPHETAAQALAREVEEEAALRLTGSPELAGVYLNRALNGRDHILLYRCPAWELAGAFRPNAEIADARFFPRHGLPEDLSRGTRRRLAEFSGEAAVSPEW